jgi:uncharacterized protein YkwD
MRNALPKVLITSLIVAILAAYPSHTSASQLSLIFPLPTVTIPPMNNVHLQNTGGTQQSISVHVSADGTTTTTEIITPTTPPFPTTRPTTSPIPTPTTEQEQLQTKQILFPTARPTLIPLRIRRLTPSPTKPAPTAKPTTVVTPTIQPTTKPVATSTPSPTTAPASTTIIRDYIMTGINNYRSSLGLSSVKISDETCAFAKIRAKEISTGFNHSGFENRVASKTIPYKTWTSITENIAMTSQYKDVVNMWINSPGHAANMRKDTPFICVENYGNYYAYEGMRP